MAALRKAKWDFCLIGTPPDEIDVIDTAVLEGEATLIPVRVSELDIAARRMVDLCHRRRKPFAFILTQVKSKPDFRKITMPQSKRCANGGRALEATFPMNKAYVASLADHTLQGKTGHEIDAKLEAVIAGIWKAVEKIGDPPKTCAISLLLRQKREGAPKPNAPPCHEAVQQTNKLCRECGIRIQRRGKKRYLVGVHLKSASQQPEPMAQMGNAP